ncbi:hypothetical protein MMC25_005570 [Agyrium rufum]|nr:hypothetical protein [Agyrium rufum]
MQSLIEAARSAGGIPRMESRRALVIINMQNDTFAGFGQGRGICPPSEFVHKIKGMVPHYRNLGDIYWACTEFEDARLIGKDAKSPATQGSLSTRPNTNPIEEETDSAPPIDQPTYSNYFNTSRTKTVMERASAKSREEQRNSQIQSVIEDSDIGDYLSKPRKGQLPEVFRPGTRGAALMDELLPVFDPMRDVRIVKHHYSAFDATPLLLTLRMKLVTHVYLCGCLSNVSIYSTAADAVRHGFEVTVVEDCMGYKSEEKHIEAMFQMADMLGVAGITSEEIIQEATGNLVPDTDEPVFSGPGYEGIANTLPQGGNRDRRESNVRSGLRDLRLSNETIAAPEVRSPTINDEGTSKRDQGRTSRRPRDIMIGQTLETRSSNSPDPSIRSPRLLDVKSRPSKQANLGPGDRLGEGDSTLISHALTPKLSTEAFALLKSEVSWQTMRHRSGEVPRLVAVQGHVDLNGVRPVYRHPADESPPLLPFSPTIQRVRAEVEHLLQQPFNHALIQLYRDGQDNISEHSDKTLDIVRESSVINLSLGAQRIMTLRTKKAGHGKAVEGTVVARQSQRIAMPHNSIFVLGPLTNRRWLHGIRADKRRPAERSDQEKAFDGERISITFRQIGTFTDTTGDKIWGQGAHSKSKADAGVISTGNSAEMDAMIVAFGKENQQIDFNWDAEYGNGFDVVNLISKTTQLYLCSDRIANLRVMLSILERGFPCEMIEGMPAELTHKTSTTKPKTIYALSGDQNPVFRDVDDGSSEIIGDLAILYYLGKFYPLLPPTGEVSTRLIHRVTANVFGRTTQANEILYLWQQISDHDPEKSSESASLRRMSSERPSSPDADKLEEFKEQLDTWEDYADETEFVGGEFFAAVDCAFWPVLDDVVTNWGEWDAEQYPNLMTYHDKVATMASVRKAMEILG